MTPDTQDVAEVFKDFAGKEIAVGVHGAETTKGAPIAICTADANDPTVRQLSDAFGKAGFHFEFKFLPKGCSKPFFPSTGTVLVPVDWQEGKWRLGEKCELAP